MDVLNFIVITFKPYILTMPDSMRRATGYYKNIKEIDPKNDIRVRVGGTILSKDDDSISVDDGSGTVDVFLEEEKLEDLEENQRVQILGRVLPTPDSFEIQGEIVQNLEDVDPEVYSRVKKLVNTT